MIRNGDEESDDCLVASSKYPVTQQYKILFSDTCYIFMFLGGSQIFGQLGAVGGSIVQEVVIWDMSEDFGSIMAAVCVIVGLISTVIYGIAFLNYKRQFLLFNLFQVISAIGIAISFLGLYLKSIPIFVAGTLFYSIFTFPSFLIMMELIGKRVGKEFDLVATGNVYFLTQVITAAMLELIGVMLNDKDRNKSAYSMLIMFTLLMLNGLFGVIASKTYDRPFKVDIRQKDKAPEAIEKKHDGGGGDDGAE